MKQEEYRNCMSKAMKGKILTGDERKLEFCINAKVCSKGVSREEAKGVCLLPKPPKPPKNGKGRKKREKSCPDEAVALATCMAEVIDMDMASNINSIGPAMANAIIQCTCEGE